MDNESVYRILRDTVSALAKIDHGFRPLPESFDPAAALADLGLDMLTLPEIHDELKNRLDGKDPHIQDLTPEEINTFSLGDLITRIRESIRPSIREPLVVCVDDEEDNLFVFNRRFGKMLRLKLFTDPIEALEFIRTEPDVALVITDEVMPKLNGNVLCTEVRKTKPFLKFILITGNPNNDQELMYNSLRHGRFFEFISKPLDLANKGEEYLGIIQGLLPEAVK
jgi:CheY-like chemotaxis protein